MMTAHQYSFRKATLDDLDLLKAWQSNPHVSEWWDSDKPYDKADLADPRVARWIVANAERQFGFMQDYTVHGWKDHHFSNLPNGSRGIDQYIGDPEMIGVGHGSAIINKKMQALFEAGAPVIATDPHPDNERAIAVYKNWVSNRLAHLSEPNGASSSQCWRHPEPDKHHQGEAFWL